MENDGKQGCLHKLLKDYRTGQVTGRQVFLALRHFFSLKRISSGDDFNWDSYSRHYSEELKSIERSTRLVINSEDIIKVERGKIALREISQVLLPSHHALYEAITWFEAKSVFEAGFGGGDHLANLSTINGGLTLSGVDRLPSQLEILQERHPGLQGDFIVGDLTAPLTGEFPLGNEIVYSHAVLMHISERNGRFQTAINNVVRLASRAVVLVENWSQHDFLKALSAALDSAKKESWKIYIHESSSFPGNYALVACDEDLPLIPIDHYDQLLRGATLRTH